jgi:hypothetical protein
MGAIVPFASSGIAPRNFEQTPNGVPFEIFAGLNQGTVGPYDGHADCHYLNENIPVQHQYKVYYNVNMPNNLMNLVKKT